MQTIPKKKPGPAKGSLGHDKAGRKASVHDLPTAAFVARCHLFPRQAYPGNRALYTAMGLGARAFSLRLAGERGFTAEQLAVGNALLNKHTPAPWSTVPPVPNEENMLPD